MSAPHAPSPSEKGLPTVLWSRDLDQVGPAEAPWLWHGFLRPGFLTLLTSLWKSGKTTLLAILLARMKTGGLLLGRAVAAGKALVVSEEESALWRERKRRLAFGDDHAFLCRPFVSQPTPAQWRGLLDQVADLHARHQFALLVFDSLGTFLPGHAENCASLLLEHLALLQALASNGLSVWLPHHPRKRESAPGMAARGSGALTAYVDVILEMAGYARGEEGDRRRRLCGWSRSAETPRQLVIELNAEGTDYLCHGAPAEEEYARGWQAVLEVLARAEARLTLQEMLDDWPVAAARPGAKTLWRWLDRAVSQGLVCRDGAGRRSSPFRYWLADQEARWRQANPDYAFELLVEQDRKRVEALGRAFERPG
jgi:hypothetical protein